MWDTRVAAPLNIVHLGYGFGAIFANLLVRPFLHNDHRYANATISSQSNSTFSTSIPVPLNTNIRVPYLITGSLCFLIGIGHLIFFIQDQVKKSNKAETQQVSNVFIIIFGESKLRQYDFRQLLAKIWVAECF
jgi:fucose permease